MSNPLIDWEQNIIYLSQAINVKLGKETKKQIERNKKKRKK